MAKSLNPCSNGICSQRINWLRHGPEFWQVLILVLMEYALREPGEAVRYYDK